MQLVWPRFKLSFSLYYLKIFTSHLAFLQPVTQRVGLDYVVIRNSDILISYSSATFARLRVITLAGPVVVILISDVNRKITVEL
jgi:hypothetical protein